jgi:hypothetical protein
MSVAPDSSAREHRAADSRNAGVPRSQREESMSEGFTIANFRHVARRPVRSRRAQEGGGLADLNPIYKQLLDQPVYTSQPAPFALRGIPSIDEVA